MSLDRLQDDAFDAAFAEASQEPSSSNEPIQEPALQAEVDHNATVNQPVIEEPQQAVITPEMELEALRKERDQLFHRLNSDNGRVAAFQRNYEEERAKREELEKRLSAMNVDKQQTGETKEEHQEAKADALAKLSKEFPELASAIQESTKQLRAEMRGDLDSVKAVTQQIEQNRQQQFISNQYAALEAAHPDYRQVVNSAVFGQWISQQPPMAQQIMSSNNASDAAWLLTQFKRDMSIVSQQRQSQVRQQKLADSVGVRTRSTRTTDLVPDDFEGAFNYYSSRK